MTSRRAGSVGIDERVAALTDAVSDCEGRVPDEVLVPARSALERAAQRRAHGEQLVVVALAGGTGTGKSSLFNAVAGHDLSAVDVTRPTTSETTAWVVADVEEAVPLLDWLEVPADRRFHAPATGRPDGLVLLDLPDIDSFETANQVIAGRLIERVDVLVWVVDPHKYAQASLHEGHLARLAEHAEVMHVVLNQIDRLDPDEVSACLDDLRHLVAGRRGPQVLTTSAQTGAGLDRLTAAIHRDVTEKRAMAARIAADVRSAAADLTDALEPPAGADVGRGRHRADDLLDPAALTSAMGALAGVDGIGARARDVYLEVARASTRSAVLRFLALVAGAMGAVATVGRATGRLLGTSTSPAAGRLDPTVPTTEVEHVLAGLAVQARHQLPWSWATRFHDVTNQVVAGLPNALKAAVAPVSHRPDRRRWWTAVAWIGTAAELLIAVGTGWLLASRVTPRTTLPSPPLVMVNEDVSLAGVLIGVGIVSWLVLLVVRQVAIRIGARRHRRVATRAAHTAIDQAVEATAIAPLRHEIDTYTRVRRSLARAAR